MGFPEVGVLTRQYQMYTDSRVTLYTWAGSIANFNDVVRIRMDLDYQGPTIDRKLEI